jgi:hypothetical protein
VPLGVAGIFFTKNWLKAFCLILCGLLIDLDHLLADPIYDPNRCSIGFHPLHTFWMMPVYLALMFHPKTRLVGIGLWIHIILDGIDCLPLQLF